MNPDKFTITETFLDVGDGHELYLQEWGNPKATTPIIFLHGGPGSECKDKHKASFDPERQHLIFFDQRGCGKSQPKASLEHNTTTDLVEDIEKIAKRFKLEKFIITGGSWGSCLALAYSLKYPKRVQALVLNGIFTGSQQEIAWLDKGKFLTFFPDLWESYLSQTPKAHHQDPSSYHFKRMMSSNPQTAKASAYIYNNVEGALLNLDDRFIADDFATYDPAGIRIEVHYLQHRCFMPDRYILNNAHKLTMPVWLVQGRYDMVCPPVTAYELHKNISTSQLIWTLSGHKAERESVAVMRAILLQLSGNT